MTAAATGTQRFIHHTRFARCCVSRHARGESGDRAGRSTGGGAGATRSRTSGWLCHPDDDTSQAAPSRGGISREVGWFQNLAGQLDALTSQTQDGVKTSAFVGSPRGCVWGRAWTGRHLGGTGCMRRGQLGCTWRWQPQLAEPSDSPDVESCTV